MAISLIISRLLYARDLHENKSLAKRRNEALDNRIGECFNNNSKGVEPIFQLSPPCGGTFFARVSPAKPFQLSPPCGGTFFARVSPAKPFQLSPPVRGVTISNLTRLVKYQISTLTPFAGCDVMTALLRRPVVISTLSPCAWHDTKGRGQYLFRDDFNSHAL